MGHSPLWSLQRLKNVASIRIWNIINNLVKMYSLPTKTFIQIFNFSQLVMCKFCKLRTMYDTSTQSEGHWRKKNEKPVSFSADWKQRSQLSVQHVWFIFWRFQCESQHVNQLFCPRVLSCFPRSLQKNPEISTPDNAATTSTSLH